MSHQLDFEEWVDIISPILKEKKEHVLLSLFSQTGWPEKGVFLEVLKKCANVFSNDTYQRRDYLDDKSSSSLSGTDKKHERNENFWRAAVERYQISSKFCCTPLGLVWGQWLVGKRYDQALALVLKNSSEIEIEELYSQKTDFMFFDSGHDKCTLGGALVMGGAISVLKTLGELAPNWVNWTDKRDRNALFYARSTTMADYLLSTGSDVHQLSKDNQDVRTFWTSNFKFLPKINEWVPLLIDYESSADPQKAQRESMVHKVWSLDFDALNDAEKEEMKTASQNSSWDWEGSLAGVRRRWTMSEILVFGKLSLALKQSPLPPYFKKGYSGLMGGSNNRLSNYPNELKSAFSVIDEKIKDLIGSSLLKNKHQTVVEKMMIALMNVSDQKDVLISVTASTNQYSYQVSQSYTTPANNMTLLEKNTQKFFNSLSLDERQHFFNLVQPFITAPWFYSTQTMPFFKSLAFSLAHPLQETKGLADPSWCDHVSGLSQEDPMRGGAFAGYWADAFNKWSSTITQHSDLSNAECVLKIGLSLLGNSQVRKHFSHRLISETSSGLKKLIKLGVKTQKIPARWSKNLEPELQSLVSAWVIEKALSERKKTRQKIEDDTPKPRRRM